MTPTNLQLNPACLPLLENQSACFGQRISSDPACQICIMEEMCEQRKQQKLAEFTVEWTRLKRIGSPSEVTEIKSATSCVHCRSMLKPGDGMMRYVKGKGTYHLHCVDLAFPPIQP